MSNVLGTLKPHGSRGLGPSAVVEATIAQHMFVLSMIYNDRAKNDTSCSCVILLRVTGLTNSLDMTLFVFFYWANL
jgi:hypothetical protein